MRHAVVMIGKQRAGLLSEDEKGYHFQYDKAYLLSSKPRPASMTLPLREAPYHAAILFPFFDGLIPEGWLLDIAEKNWKLDPRDRMGLLLACCKDCIGSVSVENLSEDSP